MNHLGNAGQFIVDTIFSLVLYLVILRFWMQWARANFRNPIGQLVINLSNPAVIPLRRLIPSIGSIDTATLLLALAIVIIKVYILVALAGSTPAWVSLLLYSVGEIIKASINLFSAAIIIQIIASWINPHAYHPILDIARAIAEPLMAPARRLIPSMGGLDLSPMLVFFILRLCLILIVSPLQHA